MTGAPTLIAARGLVVGRRAPLLRDVDWELHAGQAWFVVGRNGSGKSSLVATMLGLLPPLAGERAECPDLAQRLGYVPQELQFEPPMPIAVAEFVGLAQPAAWRRDVRAAAVDEALTQLGVCDLRWRRLSALSTGQRRRVMVAQALARRPGLIVLDEPAANLDAVATAALAADLDRLRRERDLCVVQVSHDLAVARRYATHIAFVHGGAVAARAAAPSWDDPILASALEPVVS
ncbi:MAG: metal ABC transporter ATP-binding protein [Planctomycetota bacterium]